MPIGILPTLSSHDFSDDTVSDEARYRAMTRGLRRLRVEPFRIRIEGRQELELEVRGVVLESANTSWQVHLRTPPADFDRVFNAAQLATGPVLAVAGNSPMLFGRELWEETRVPLFEEAADDRDIERRFRREGRVAFGTDWAEGGAAEAIARCVRDYEPILPLLSEEDPAAVVKAGGVPRLEELRLHQGTVWQWNRPVYDPAGGGHLRVEMRALPAGPSVPDMVANAAFLIGLVLALADDPGWRADFPFAGAYRNFYRAARDGLDAALSWPGREGETPAAELARELLPLAARGLELGGVDAEEAGRTLAVIGERIARRRTGAVWQRATVAGQGRDRRATARMVTRYRELALGGDPVHAWR
ncbi:glutamate--cysteine ligase [Thermocatellispora tengchongensis]|uniref:glutamate--cysteine ligase n=1 Tax=Thermocatellispora tengchongensis TaxID=1073253 RepID=UPI00362BC77E